MLIGICMAKFLYLSKNHMNQLEAFDSETEDELNKMKTHDVIKVPYTKPRSPRNHRRWRALVNMVFLNQDRYETEKDLIVEIKLKAGHYSEHITTKGKIIYVPDSLAFDEIDEIEFKEFFEKAINSVLKHFIDPDNEQLIEKIIRF